MTTANKGNKKGTAQTVKNKAPETVVNPFANLTPEQMMELLSKMQTVVETQQNALAEKEAQLAEVVTVAKNLKAKINDKFPQVLPFNSLSHLELVEITLDELKKNYRAEDYIIGLDEGEKQLTYCFVAFAHDATEKIQTFQINKAKQKKYFGVNITIPFSAFADMALIVSTVDEKTSHYYPFQIYKRVYNTQEDNAQDNAEKA